jgi:glycerophosphoryl diester phosphodiesterase
VGVAVLSPKTPRALLTDPKQSYASTLHALARPRLVTALHVERHQATPRAIRTWKERGLRVGVWTVNDDSEAVALARAGADLLITDGPGVLLRALQ